MRPVKFFRTALTRQLAEAVRIQRWGEDIVLNSRSEYNRCKIGRLTIGENLDKEAVLGTLREQNGQAEEEADESTGENNIKK